MSMILIPSATVTAAVGVASVQFAGTMLDGVQYILTSNVGAWIAIGANPTAQKQTSGSIYIPPNYPMQLIGQGANIKVAIIEDSAGGFASLSQTLS